MSQFHDWKRLSQEYERLSQHYKTIKTLNEKVKIFQELEKVYNNLSKNTPTYAQKRLFASLKNNYLYYKTILRNGVESTTEIEKIDKVIEHLKRYLRPELCSIALDDHRFLNSLFTISKEKSLVTQIEEYRKLIAKKLYLYSFFLGIENGRLSFKGLTYIFETLFSKDIAAMKMNEWVNSSEGVISMALITSSFIVSSLLVYHIDPKNKDFLVRSHKRVWLALRDLIKGLTGGKKGIDFIVNLSQIFEIKDLRHLAFPLCIIFGVLNVANRFWMRHRSGILKEFKEENELLLAELNSGVELNRAQIRQKMEVQLQQLNKLALLSSAFSGFMDGMKPGIGFLIMPTLSPPILTTIMLFCAIYFLSALSSKIYDEIQAQNTLKISQKKIEIALLSNEQKCPEISTTQYEQYTKQIKEEKEKLAILLKNSSIEITGIQNGLSVLRYMRFFMSLLSLASIPELPPLHRAIIGLTTLTGAFAGTVLASPEEDKSLEMKYVRNSNLLFNNKKYLQPVNPETYTNLCY